MKLVGTCSSLRKKKEIKNVDEFQEYILQQKPANTKVKHKVIGRREMRGEERFREEGETAKKDREEGETAKKDREEGERKQKK